MKQIKSLSLLLISLIGLSLNGCGNENSSSSSKTNVSTSSSSSLIVSPSIEIEVSDVSIKEFNFVYTDNGSSKIYDAIFDLNTNIKRKTGHRLQINKLDANYSEAPYEIIIGNIDRANISNEYNSLSDTDLLIKSIETENGIKILVGGKDESSTLFALNEFLNVFLEGNIVDFSSKNIYKNINYKYDYTSIYLSNDELKEYTILYSENSDEIVKKAIDNLLKDFSKALDFDLNIKACNRNTDLSDIKKGIYIGPVNDESEVYSSGLSTNSYNIQVKHTSLESKIFIVGTSNQEVLNGIHYFYKTSVVNGKLNVPKYVAKPVNSLEQRDPCIVPYNNMYYMYSATGSGFAVRSSTDLLNWSDSKVIFDASDSSSFTGIGDYWAPECHYYNNNFYLFVTYRSSTNNHRGCAIFKSSTPDGRFKEITNGHITPSDWDAIDGTLYIDKNNKPYMVFVHEWTSMPDGNGLMCYAPLSDDFTHFTAEPKTMFKSTDPSWTDQCVTDGPWLYRLENGTLLMIWSNFARDDFNGYTIGISKSSNGELDGTWEHYDEPLFWDDLGNVYEVINGGHGMIFKGFDNRIYLALHGPNANNNETYYFSKFMYIPLVEDNDNNTLKLDLIY